MAGLDKYSKNFKAVETGRFAGMPMPENNDAAQVESRNGLGYYLGPHMTGANSFGGGVTGRPTPWAKIPLGQRPMTIGEPIPTGMDDAGRTIYTDMASGRSWAIDPTPGGASGGWGDRRSIREYIGDAWDSYTSSDWDDRIGAGSAIVKAITEGFTVPGKVASGEDFTLGDVWMTALDGYAPGGAAKAPSGALRSGPSRSTQISRPAQKLGDSIDDDVVAVGRDLTPAQALPGNESGAFSVWHGSPHDFKKFDFEKIGTGEGAQAYGHGGYFAERPGVAKSYRDALAKQWMTKSGADETAIDFIGNLIDEYGGFQNVGPYEYDTAVREWMERNMYNNMDYNGSDAVREAVDRTYKSLTDFNSEVVGNSGHLYEANINANPEDFLDWDLPLSEQSEAVQELAKSADISAAKGPTQGMMRMYREGAEQAHNPATGKTLYRAMSDYGNDSVGGSKAIQEAGFPGIKYFDQGSRAAGEGSRNYVVFNDDLVDILSKDGVDTPAQAVARLHREGRGNEVTDDMLAAFTPNDHMEMARLMETGAASADRLPIPMDEASRMARAKEMGQTDAYHGSPTDFVAVDRSKYGGMDIRGRGFNTSTNPDRAQRWAGEGGVVMPVRLNNASPLDTMERGTDEVVGRIIQAADDLGFGTEAKLSGKTISREGIDPEMFFPDNFLGDIQGNINRSVGPESGSNILEKAGYTGVKAPEGFGHVQDVVFDPANIRSRFARFHPDLKHLANLSAGVGGGAFTLEQLLAEKERRKGLQQ